MARSSRPRHTMPDANQAEIVAALRGVGCLVWDLSPLGGTCMDLLIARPATDRRGWWLWLVEVKNPARRYRYTVAQRQLIAACPGLVQTLRTVDEALALVGATVAGAAGEMG